MRSLVAVVLACAAALADAQGCNAKPKTFTANFDNLMPGTSPPDNYGSVGWSNFKVGRKNSFYGIIPSTLPRLVSAAQSEPVPYIFQTNYTDGSTPGSAALETFVLRGFSFGCVASQDGFFNFVPNDCTITVVANSYFPGIDASTQSFSYSSGSNEMANVTTGMTGTDFYFLITSAPGNSLVSFDSFKISQYICK